MTKTWRVGEQVSQSQCKGNHTLTSKEPTPHQQSEGHPLEGTSSGNNKGERPLPVTSHSSGKPDGQKKVSSRAQQPEGFRWHFPEATSGDQQRGRKPTATRLALQHDALDVVFRWIGMDGEQLRKRLAKATNEERQREGWPGPAWRQRTAGHARTLRCLRVILARTRQQMSTPVVDTPAAESTVAPNPPTPVHEIRQEGEFTVISTNPSSIVKPPTQDAILGWQPDVLLAQEPRADQQALVGLSKAARARGWHLAPGKPSSRVLAEQDDGRLRSIIPCGGALGLSRKHVQAEALEQLSEDEMLLWDSTRFASLAHPLGDGTRFVFCEALYLPSGESYEAKQGRRQLLQAYFAMARGRPDVPIILGMDLNDDPYTQVDIAQAKQEGWCDAADLQQA